MDRAIPYGPLNRQESASCAALRDKSTLLSPPISSQLPKLTDDTLDRPLRRCVLR